MAADERFLLWDIDGTLVRAGDIGAAVFDRALEFVVGAAPAARIHMSGKTDPQIVGEYFEIMGLEGPEVLNAVLARAEVELALATDELISQGSVCPGVPEVLRRLGAIETVTQSLLTGNIKANARVKVGVFGLDELLDFEVGAFGSDHADRSRLVPIALERAAARRGRSYEPEAVWVIGDTPNDLACARAGGVRCLLVATGRYGYGELADLGADAVLPDLSETDRVLEVLGVV